MTLDEALAVTDLLNQLAGCAGVAPLATAGRNVVLLRPATPGDAAHTLGEHAHRRLGGGPIDGDAARHLVDQLVARLGELRARAATYERLLASLEERHGRICHACGCSEFDPCWDEEAGGCSWVGENLCSACAPPARHENQAGGRA